ncbi:hypothetical protein LZL87_012107 [Fusarium oxysporum]|nr:hypothetical protein LZL87_012107 [Fusarium oxysporum]
MSLPGLKTLHKKPYHAIYPTRPELSQEGRTILITGGNSGIGFPIARSFVISKAKRVIVASLLSAASLGKNKPLLEAGRDEVWGDFETNTRAIIDFTTRFYGQEAQGIETRKLVLEVSPKKMQISIFHPGIIFNELAAASGMNDTTYPWDDENLPGNFAVWAASHEAEFIHGPLVWAAWDVEELKTRIEDGVKKNPRFLMAGIKGLSTSVDDLPAQWIYNGSRAFEVYFKFAETTVIMI